MAAHELFKEAVNKHQVLKIEDEELQKNQEKQWAYQTMAKPVDMRFKNKEDMGPTAVSLDKVTFIRKDGNTDEEY